MIRLISRVLCLSFVAVLSTAPFSPSQAAEDFYAGKQIRLLVGTDANGTYDSNARILARHMGKHIPGNPSFIVQNMPGAASMKMTSYVYNGASNDGTVIAMGQNTIPTSPLTSPNEARYDTGRLSWLGSATREAYVGYVWHTAPVKTMEEAKTTQVLMGGSAVGTFSIDSALIANTLFGMKFKPIIGYKSSGETKLAVQKGEVHGVMGTNWASLKREVDWFKNNWVRYIVQYGLRRDPQLSDIPLFIDFAKNEEDLKVAKFWVSVLEHGKPYFAPPGVPADRLAILRRAFDSTMKDPGYLKDMETAGENVEGPMGWQELTQLVAEEASTPPSVVQRIGDAVQQFLKEGR